ncbi:hypothetical protein ACFFRR_004348 [Megaselia abdita]
MSGMVNDGSTKLQNVDLNNTPLSDDTPSTSTSPQPKKNWVKFDEENNVEDRRKEEYEDMSLDSNGNSNSNSNTPAILSPPPQAAKRSHARTSPDPSEQQKFQAKTTATSSSHQRVADETPAVLTTESVHVNVSSSSSTAGNQKQPSNNNLNNGQALSETTTTTITTSNTNSNSTTNNRSTSPQKTTTANHQHHHQPQQKSTSITIPVTEASMRTIELSTGRIREGFASGDVIVTLLPTNTKWPWITPAVFRPELVPEELMAQGLTLTVEEYVNAMETLVNDYRFTVYNICYKRILVCWILFAFCVLLALLFSGLQGLALFSLGVGWLFLNAAAIFFCMWVKLRLARGLEKCLARVNKQLMRHKILIVLDDRGRISCHKVNLCFIYFDPTQCISYLNEFIERCEQNGANIQAGWESKLDIDVNDIVIQGSNTTRVSRKQERSMLLFLRYASRWGNEAVRGLRDVSSSEPARHCAKYLCPCQFIEEHLTCKPRGKWKFLNIVYWVLASERYD